MPAAIPLLVICGPTATGKTEAAVRVARSVGGEIISADSMQIYRELEVGTAKPTKQERAFARFHLIDFVAPDRPYAVADFQADARQAIASCWGRGNLPILCGGTGLYVRALLEGFDFPPACDAGGARVRAALEQELARVGAPKLHARLRAVDPATAARVAPADAKRIVRALEVFELTGAPMGLRRRVDAIPGVRYNPLHYVLTRPREHLYAGIDARVEQMMAAGWLDEVRSLLARGYDPALQSLQAIGYRHLVGWQLSAEPVPSSLDNLVEVIKRDTRRFAKRQLTWFRRDAQALWREWDTAAGFRRLVSELCVRAETILTRGAGHTS